MTMESSYGSCDSTCQAAWRTSGPASGSSGRTVTRPSAPVVQKVQTRGHAQHDEGNCPLVRGNCNACSDRHNQPEAMRPLSAPGSIVA